MKKLVFLSFLLFSQSVLSQQLSPGGEIHIVGHIVDDSCEINSASTGYQDLLKSTSRSDMLTNCEQANLVSTSMQTISAPNNTEFTKNPNSSRKDIGMMYTLSYQ